MIPRRIMQHVRDQNWTAIAIDLAIVVVGVFIGIQVSNWNEDRIERTKERELLVRLHEDIDASIAGQSRDLDFLKQQLADQALILASLRACEVPSADAEAFQRGVATLGFINPPRFFRRTVDEIASSGNTDIIQSSAIKERLAEITALVEWRAYASEDINRSSEHHRFVIEDRVAYDVDRTYDDRFLGQFFGVDFDIDALCRESSARSAVSAISNITQERYRAYQPILELYRAFLPLVERELKDRWGLEIAASE